MNPLIWYFLFPGTEAQRGALAIDIVGISRRAFCYLTPFPCSRCVKEEKEASCNCVSFVG